jgi:hypothetical protein
MFYTTRQRGDGFGGIFQNVIFDALFASVHGHTYVYTPQHKIEHNYTNDPTFNERLFKFLNLEQLFPKPLTDERIYEYDYGSVYPFVEQNIDKLYELPIMKSIQDAFFQNKISPYDSTMFNVAVHIRRPNTHDMGLAGERANTLNSVYINTMKKIQQTYKGDKKIQFHIYSQSAFDGYEEFSDFNTQFHIDTSLEHTLLGLMYADTLVLSRSSLSYVSAFITKGEVYYIPFWHPPLKHWHTI